MSNILDKIVAAKWQEINAAKARMPAGELEAHAREMPPARNFAAALQRAGQVQVIAEVKKASPSAGVIRADFDPLQIAYEYAGNGAAAISVLTDGPFFQGSLAYLELIRRRVWVPLLRKDFILDVYQLLEARCAGADAVLLIAECLDDVALKHLLAETRTLGMEALVELYDRENVSRVLDAGATVVGVNNRDLRTFVTRLEHTLEIAEMIPDEIVLVGESGIRTYADLQRLQSGGVDAVLVGESLMRSPDIGRAVRELRGVAE